MCRIREEQRKLPHEKLRETLARIVSCMPLSCEEEMGPLTRGKQEASLTHPTAVADLAAEP
jgi:hypothetical protein